MRARLATLAVAIVVTASAAGTALAPHAGERTIVPTGDVRAVLARDAAAAGARLGDHDCTERPSALFGEHTLTCRVELSNRAGQETVTRVLTPFDRGWAVTGR